ncbi:MAG: hypothetical protein D6791_10220 [Chloroflexi bacterium]|nr:MAG: hypothetical protein D6791_10220 [Chloroflexota bacterium]
MFWLAKPWVILEVRVVHRIPVYQANTMQDPAFVRRLADLNPDLIVLFSFNLIIPEEIIKLPRFGCINVHPSLLPKYRGAHPHFWVLVKGETSTGVTVHYVDAGVDTGDIIIQDAVVGESGTRRSRRDGVTHFPRSRGGFVFPTDKRGGWLNRLGNACIRDRPAHSNCVCR